MFRIDFWELGPLGWRGCSELDERFPLDVAAVVQAAKLLADSMRDGVVAYAAVVRERDGEVVWEGRNHSSVDMSAMHN